MAPHSDNVDAIFAKHPSVEQDVRILSTWLEKQRHLPSVSDLQLVTFLNSCDHRIEAAKACIDAYFTIKCWAHEYFRHRDPLGNDIRDIRKLVQVMPLTHKTEEGCTIIMGRLLDHDVTHYSPEVATKLLFLVIDAALRHEPMAPGIVFVYDMTGATFQHVTKMAPSALKKYMRYVQEAMPVKLRAMHVINSNSLISKIMMFIRPFMNADHINLLNFHTADQMETFYRAVPQKRLPKEYGGADESVQVLAARTDKLLASYRDWFLAEEAHCVVNEALRETKLTHVDGDLFGRDGSFKKLSID